LLSAALKPEGFNVGFNLGSAVAGGSIAHLHAHIVPRWNGDNNFMPVVAQTRMLPQSLESTWKRITAAATALSSRKTTRPAPKRKAAPRPKSR
jgi:ATP adenylyltransferase